MTEGGRRPSGARILLFTSDEWLRTRDYRYALVGNGPLVVLKASGDLYQLGTGRSVDDKIVAFEARLSSHS
jgi:hypothetical protein